MSLKPGGAPAKKEPIVRKMIRPEGPAKMSAASTAEPQSVKQAPPRHTEPVQKTTSNGASEPTLPPTQSGPALPAVSIYSCNKCNNVLL